MNKTLIVVRHAKSSWDYPELSDHDRPLNARGLRNAPLMGERLLEYGVAPQLILSSSAQRAFSTAEIIAQALHINPVEIVVDSAIYGAWPDALMQRIGEVDDGVDSVMLVGHNPGVTELVNSLADADIDNIPTCGAAVMRLTGDNWASVKPGGAQLEHYDFPKNRAPSKGHITAR